MAGAGCCDPQEDICVLKRPADVRSDICVDVQLELGAGRLRAAVELWFHMHANHCAVCGPLEAPAHVRARKLIALVSASVISESVVTGV